MSPSLRRLASVCAATLLSGCVVIPSAVAFDSRYDDRGGIRWMEPDERSYGRRDDPRVVLDRWGRPVLDRFGRPVYVDRQGRQVPTDGYGRPLVRNGFEGPGGVPPWRADRRDDPRDRLSKGQSAALDEGCMERYDDDPKKLRRCLNGDRRLFPDALEDGCHIRYAGNAKKLGACLREATRGNW